MSGSVDPYYTWLGIAPEEQPPNHYRLLGIRLFEDNLDVISHAADRQMAHLRTFQTGAHAAESQRLLNEVATARVCLLNAGKKAEYDANLRAKLPAPATPPAPPPAEPASVLDSQLVRVLAEEQMPRRETHPAPKRAAPTPTRARRPKKAGPLPVWLVGGAAGLALALLIGAIASRPAKPQPCTLMLNWPLAERQNAIVVIDDQDRQVTGSDPLAVVLHPGEHRLRISWPFCEPFQCVVRLRPGERQTLAVPGRQPLRGVLVFDWPAGQRRGSALFIDERQHEILPHGEFRVRLAPGEHTVRAVRPGYDEIHKSVTIASGEETSLTVSWFGSEPPPPPPPKTGPGLLARLFVRGKLEAPVLVRRDADIHCAWDEGTPDTRLSMGEYSIHWSGWLKAPASGRYKFRLLSEGLARFWLDDRQVIGDVGSTEAEVDLDSAPHLARLEYDAGPDRGQAILNWVPPGEFLEQTVPAETWFLDRASAEEATVPLSVLAPRPGEVTPQVEAGRPIDLLRLLDVARDAVKGRWWFQGKSLVCEFGERDPPCLMKIPFTPPGEYEVKATVERLSGDDVVAMGLVVDGHKFDVMFDGWPQDGGIGGVELIDKARVNDRRNPTRVDGRIIPRGKKVQLTYSVRKDRLLVTRDGEKVIDWPADYSRCSPWEQWDIHDSSHLSLGVFRGILRCSQLELTPLHAAPGAVGGLPVAVPIVVPGKKRLPVPDEPAQQAAAAAVREKYARQYQSKQTHAVLALAATLIRAGREAGGKPAEPYVLFREARDLATAKGDCLLALLAIRELESRFEVPLGDMGPAAVTVAANRARTPAAVSVALGTLFSEMEKALEATHYEAWEAALSPLEKSLRKTGGSAAARVFSENRSRLATQRAMYQESQAAIRTLGQSPDDPAASGDLGRYECLAKSDWDKALPWLAKDKEARIREPAARLMASRGDVAAQLAMGDAWWEMAGKERHKGALRTLLTEAACCWYVQALPRLTGADRAKIERRMIPDSHSPATASQPFQVLLHGVGGLMAMLPGKPPSGKLSPQGGFATFEGRVDLEYDQVPATCYVHEVEFTFSRPGGALFMHYGDLDEGSKTELVWDDKENKYRSRALHYWPGWVSWGGTCYYNPGERMRWTFYVNANQHRLFQGETEISGCGGHATDLRFRLSTNEQAALVIHRCEFRPWHRGDAERLRCAMPPTSLKADWPETALRLHDRHLALGDRPIISNGGPYVVPSTGTAMQWIAPGKFRHPSPKKKGEQTEITLTHGFWMGRHEITQGEWMTLMPDNPSRVAGSPFLPVDSVSWEDAGKFCMLLNQGEIRAKRLPNGYVYRLPTEAEWEYACRAGATEDFVVPSDGFWSSENSGWRPHEVGEGKPNAWGLYDMHGNVSEWCLDAFQDEPDTPAWKLTDPFTPPKSKDAMLAVRGGGWWCGRGECSSVARDRSRSIPGGYRGFRVVLGPALQ